MFFTVPTLYIQPYLEIRERLERRINPDFNKTTLDSRSDLLSRWRPGIIFKTNGPWSGEVQYQYNHDLAWTAKANKSIEQSNLTIGFAHYKGGALSVTGGRQKPTLGDGRLMAPGEWVFPRSFDGLDAWWHAWELFDFAISVNRVPDARFGGVIRHRKDGETSFFYKHDHPATGTVDIYTADERYNMKLGPFSFNLEGAGQTGQSGGKLQEAWAGHARVSESPCKFTTLFAEGNAASGGSSTTRTNTFDNLYPSNHDKYGLMDLQSWRNMSNIQFGAEVVPVKNVRAKIAWQHLFLNDPTDAWYTSTGAVAKFGSSKFLDTTGASGRDVGQETDVTFSWNVNKGPTLYGGVGLFNPGHFIHNVSGHGDQSTYTYLMLEHRFK